MKKGWISLHRQILDNPVSSNLELLGTLSVFLLSASHQETTFYIGFTKVVLQPGEFIFGRKKFAARFNVSESRAYRILKTLEREKIIKTKVNRRFTLVKLLNWGKYQSDKVSSEQPTNNPRTISEQPTNTINNVEQCKTIDQTLKKNKSFQTFYKWVKGMDGKIRNPEAYAIKIFSKYPHEVIKKVLRDETTTSLYKFSQNIDVYLKMERKRKDNLSNI